MTPREVGPADTTVHTHAGGPAAHLCGDSDVTCELDYIPWDRSTEDEFTKFYRPCTPCGKKR